MPPSSFSDLRESETFFEVVNIRTASLEGGVLKNFLMQRNIGFDSLNYDFTQRVLDTGESGFPRFAVNREFRESRDFLRDFGLFRFTANFPRF